MAAALLAGSCVSPHQSAVTDVNPARWDSRAEIRLPNADTVSLRDAVIFLRCNDRFAEDTLTVRIATVTPDSLRFGEWFLLVIPHPKGPAALMREAWERCREDKEYERGLLLRMRGFLHYRPVPCRCHLEYQRSPVRRIYVGYISFSRQRRRIFPSVLDAQAALVAKGWNPENFRIVEEDTQNLKSQKQ